jgi:transketolase
MNALLHCFEKAKQSAGKGKPVAFLMHTEMGFGVDFMQGNHKWHGTPPNEEQFEKAIAQIPQTLGDF